MTASRRPRGLARGATQPRGTSSTGEHDLLSPWVGAQWPDWFGSGRSVDPRAAIVAQRSGRGALVYFDTQGHPGAVVKLAWGDPDRTAIEREYRVLCQARHHAPGVAAFMPRPLGSTTVGGLTAVATELVEGQRPLLPDLQSTRPAGKRTQAALGRYLLSGWHACAGLAAEGGSQEGSPLRLGDLVEEFTRFSTVPTRVSARLTRITGEWGDHQWQPCWQHGDLAPGNVVTTASGVKLIDWEGARPDYPPWFDFLYLVAGLPRHLSGRGHARDGAARALRVVFVEVRWVSQLVERFLGRWWHHPLPTSVAFLTTALESSVRHSRQGRRTTSVWTPVVHALLEDPALRTRCPWLAPDDAVQGTR